MFIKSNYLTFPFAEIRNIRIFYYLTAVINSWWIMGNWIFFWTRYMTYGQLGLIDAIAFGFGILMEIPTGAVADLLGKKKTILVALASATVGIGLITFTQDANWILVGFLITQLGWALYSGAAEAMAYDSLVDEDKEEGFEEVISFAATLGIVTTVVTTLAGGLMYAMDFRLPHVMWGVSYIIGFIVALRIMEPQADTEKFSWSGYFRQLSTGFQQLVKPKLRQYIVFFLGLYGAFVIYDWGLVKPAIAESFGFFANEQALIFAMLGIFGAIIVRFLPYYRKLVGDTKGLYILSLIVGLSYIMMYFQLGFFGIITIATIDLFGRLAYPWLSVVLNKEVPSKYRATTISTSVLLSRLPYVVVAIFAGQAAESGQLGAFNLTVGITLIMLVALNFLLFRERRAN